MKQQSLKGLFGKWIGLTRITKVQPRQRRSTRKACPCQTFEAKDIAKVLAAAGY